MADELSAADAPQADVSRRRVLPIATISGIILAILTVLVFGAMSYRSLRESAQTAAHLHQTQDTIDTLQALLSDMKDAETGQRGYLLTGREDYLEPFLAARTNLPRALAAVRAAIGGDPVQRPRIETLDQSARAKLDELEETTRLRRANDLPGALAIVQSDRGKAAMDRIRSLITQIQTRETQRLADRERDWQAAVDSSFRITIVGAGILIALIAAAGWLLVRAHREREIEAWLRAVQAGVSSVMLDRQRLDMLAGRVLSYLSRHLDAAVATFYLDEGESGFRYLAGYADAAPPTDAAHVGVGLLAQAARDDRMLHVRDVPDDYLPVSSSLGRARARELVVAPATADGIVMAVMEFGFLRPTGKLEHELLRRVCPAIAVAIRSARESMRIDALLAETQRQTEELQTQQEELRVSNEELEEQGRALKASQAQLEGQQAELEQTNSQLEEQAQILETQKDSLARSQTILEEKANELERSNQYKSEFLANMSHELRTPLNSTLILAKLLADNKNGNLTPEQVKFAETISSAGNDLLMLINDILDLSKIEAGKVEITMESVTVSRIVEGVAKTFDAIAKDKQLAFDATIEPGTAEHLQTDAQRLSQILRNLLSNALKFTAKGRVGLRVFAPSRDRISFAVSDTGIGISENQHDVIFEAFRQADGSTHRRFGGTGLGLSISRDLARLLGGDITVVSRPEEGSTFTLTLPNAPARRAEDVARRSPPSAIASAPPTSDRQASNAAPEPSPAAGDDRDQLQAGARLILVIEDDVRFATILQELAHEMGFQCIVTHTASEGIAAAMRYVPSAVLLDMHLPDHSGLGVLDQLKQNPKTRHIPVHIASVADHSQEARALGAVGYDLKPVKREQLVEAMEGLRARFAQQLRRVLVVEDDQRQLDSIRYLLDSEDVEIVGVSSAADARAKLHEATFDCMVLDLNLPDLSGYELLEQMSQEEDVPFPPVIVYTGRMLARDEEQRLRRYSKSIIIKDARSPERLLDEVTLFLHQVESKLPADRQRMLREVRSRDTTLEGRRILIVEDDVRNVFALSRVLEPKGAKIEIARNGIEALDALATSTKDAARAIDLVLMDIMMPEMDGYTAMREIRKRPEFKKLPIIALTAKAMRDDQEKCLAAGANDYVAKPLDVEKMLSLIRVWMPKSS